MEGANISTLTPEVLADLRKKTEAATSGPWASMGKFDTQHVVCTGTQMVCNTLHENDEANATYIAAANPAVVLALLDQIAALKAENNEVHSAVLENEEMREIK